MNAKATRGNPIDQYLSNLPYAQRMALVRLRKVISEAVPGVEECISYQMPAFRLNRRALVAFGASKSHCSLFPMSGDIVGLLAADLQGFDTSKGTIRFTPEKPLGASLVKKILKARMLQILEKATNSSHSPAKNAGAKKAKRVSAKRTSK